MYECVWEILIHSYISSHFLNWLSVYLSASHSVIWIFIIQRLLVLLPPEGPHTHTRTHARTGAYTHTHTHTIATFSCCKHSQASHARQAQGGAEMKLLLLQQTLQSLTVLGEKLPETSGKQAGKNPDCRLSSSRRKFRTENRTAEVFALP